jgi:3-oxoacyl-[acyl-carrier protein] reductase
MTQPLEGKCALVTGAASGIGQATVIELAAQGAHVALLDIGDVSETLSMVDNDKVMTCTFETDVSDEDQVRTSVQGAIEKLGCIDIVVNNAGIQFESTLLDMPTDKFDRTIAVNLRGVFLVARETIRHMRENNIAGRVINIASELGYLGRADFSAYCASKSGVLGLTRSWAREYAPDILVNAVAPGPVDTPLLGFENMSEYWREKESDIPLGRVGRPEEISSVIAFLAGPGATFITGQTFSPNGGALMM